MSKESNQIGRRTAGNANIVSILGDIISSDGIQALRVPLGTPGQFLGVDLTQDCGLGWSTPGGGGTLTFSDGVTRSADNVTNDLVTGTPVTEVDAVVNFATDDSTFQMNGTDGGIALTAGDDGSGRGTIGILGGIVSIEGETSVDVDGGPGAVTLTNDTGDRVRVTATDGVELVTVAGNDISLDSNVGIDVTALGLIQITAGGSFGVTATDAIQLNALGAGGFGITLVTGGTGDININPNHDELHTIGRNFTLTAAGSGGVSIEATNGNLTLDAGPGDGTAETRIMPTVAAPAATRTFRIWNGVGTGQGTILSPTTGTVVDVEARNALDALLELMHDWGWVTNPNP